MTGFFAGLRERRRRADLERRLREAAHAGDEQQVRDLLAQGVDVNAGHGEPLIEAVLAGQAGMVRLLLERGADPNAKDEEHGVTVLMYAAEEADVEIVRLLLTAGADPHARDWMGRNAWMYAAGEADPPSAADSRVPAAVAEVQRILKEAGAGQAPPDAE